MNFIFRLQPFLVPFLSISTFSWKKLQKIRNEEETGNCSFLLFKLYLQKHFQGAIIHWFVKERFTLCLLPAVLCCWKRWCFVEISSSACISNQSLIFPLQNYALFPALFMPTVFILFTHSLLTTVNNTFWVHSIFSRNKIAKWYNQTHQDIFCF